MKIGEFARSPNSAVFVIPRAHECVRSFVTRGIFDACVHHAVLFIADSIGVTRNLNNWISLDRNLYNK